MKDTIFESKETSRRENITYHFQPNQHLDAIKSAIVKRYKQRVPHVESPLQQHHVGGLPSPPVEEKKVMPVQVISEAPLIKEQLPPTSSEIKEKIQSLKEEKHMLFQLIKQMMVQEESKRRESQKPVQATPPSTKKKSRWAPCSTDTLPYYNNASYFYPRPPPPMPRFNSNHPYSNVSYYIYIYIYIYMCVCVCVYCVMILTCLFIAAKIKTAAAATLLYKATVFKIMLPLLLFFMFHIVLYNILLLRSFL
jgi:hypothetical protein